MGETLGDLYDKTIEANMLLEPLLRSRGKIHGTKEISSKYRIAYCGVPHDTSPPRIKEEAYTIQSSPLYLHTIEDIFSETESFSGNVNFAQISEEIFNEDFLPDDKKKLILQTRIEFEDGKALTLEYRNIAIQTRRKKHGPDAPAAFPAEFNEKSTGRTRTSRANAGGNAELSVEKDILITPPRPVLQPLGYSIELPGISIEHIEPAYAINTEELESLLAGRYLGGQKRELFNSIGKTGAFSAYVRQMPEKDGTLAGAIRGEIYYKVNSEESYRTIKIKDVTKRLDEIEGLIAQEYGLGLIEDMNKVLFL